MKFITVISQSCRYTGQGFDSPHLHHIWGCNGFDRYDDGGDEGMTLVTNENVTNF